MVYAGYCQLSYKPYMMYSKPCLTEVQFQNFGHLLRVARGTSLHRQLLVLFASLTIVVNALMNHPASSSFLSPARQEVSPAPCIVRLFPPVKLPVVFLADPSLLSVPNYCSIYIYPVCPLRSSCISCFYVELQWQIGTSYPPFRPRYLAGICFAMFLHGCSLNHHTCEHIPKLPPGM